ncbi:hypothetical protein MKC53_04370 [[Clostridium] innocuum]|nr:hypothetical protein [[Clostridium] innocuum]
MKLSDIKGEAVFEVIANCIEPISNIVSDKTAMELFERRVVPEGTDIRAVALQRLVKGIPTLMRDHKADLVAILAAVNLQDADEYAETLTLTTLLSDLADLISDPMFTDFFMSAEGATATATEQGDIAASAI